MAQFGLKERARFAAAHVVRARIVRCAQDELQLERRRAVADAVALLGVLGTELGDVPYVFARFDRTDGGVRLEFLQERLRRCRVEHGGEQAARVARLHDATDPHPRIRHLPIEAQAESRVRRNVRAGPRDGIGRLARDARIGVEHREMHLGISGERALGRSEGSDLKQRRAEDRQGGARGRRAAVTRAVSDRHAHAPCPGRCGRLSPQRWNRVQQILRDCSGGS